MKFGIKPLAVSIALASAALAQADGTVEGRLIDASSKTVYSGAVVRIEELNREVLTTESGRFRIPQVAAGTYNLSVIVGGKKVETLEVTVADDQSTATQILLNEGETDVEEVLVIGQAAQLQRAIDRQRYSDQILNAVNSDAIGELPDANAAEALQRISGISIERDQGEGRFVRIRGLGAEFNSVSVNGTQIPAPEAAKRSVALDVIPANLIGSLEVRKAQTPDMDANSLGGSVEIKSVSALDREGSYYTGDLEYSYDSLTEETNPKLALGGGKTFMVGEESRLGVAMAASYEDRDFGSENVETGGAWDDGALEEVEMRDYTINRERIGAAINIDFEQDVNNSYYLRTLYSEFTDDEQREAVVIEFTDEEFDEGEALAKGEAGSGVVQRELKDRVETQKIFSASIGAEHFINDWTVEYDLSMSKAEEKEPDSIDSAVFEAELDNLSYFSSRKPVVSGTSAFYDASAFELDEIERVKSDTTDELTIASFDITRDLIVNDYPAMIKFGAKASQREKDMNVDIRKYEGDVNMADFTSGTVDYGLGNFGPSLSSDKLRAALGSLDVENDVVASHEEDYRIEEDVNAAYLMGRIDMNALQVIAGVRFEDTETNSYGFAVDGEEETVSNTRFKDSYSHTLPALLAKWEFQENTQLRAAVTHSVVRPNFEHMRPSYTLDGDELEIGNPDLKPMEARNLDLGIEHFVGNAGLVSVFGFYKSIDHFSYEVTFDEDTGGLEDFANIGEGLEEVTTFKNGDEATVKGLELAFSRKFDMLPTPFDGLLASANYTFVNSTATDAEGNTIELQDLSEESGNLTIGYEDETLSLRLATNYKSDYHNGDGIVQDQTHVDFNASYKVTEQVKVRFKAINITNEVFYVYQDSSDFNVQYEEYGPAYTLGVSYSSF